MTWTKLSLIFSLLLFPQACGVYSFSGISTPPEAKTFSVNIQSKIALGSLDLAEILQQRLSDELVQRTSLKQVTSQGDLQFEGTIQKFEYTPIVVAKEEDTVGGMVTIDQLQIEVQMTYLNPYQQDTSVDKKKFSQHANMDADSSRSEKEPSLIDEIITKLIKNIFHATVANW